MAHRAVYRALSPRQALCRGNCVREHISLTPTSLASTIPLAMERAGGGDSDCVQCHRRSLEVPGLWPALTLFRWAQGGQDRERLRGSGATLNAARLSPVPGPSQSSPWGPGSDPWVFPWRPPALCPPPSLSSWNVLGPRKPPCLLSQPPHSFFGAA